MKYALALTVWLIGQQFAALGQPRNQDVDIQWGKKLRASRGTTLQDVVGYDNSGIYAIRSVSKGLYGLSSFLALEHYDHNMNLTRSVEIDLRHVKFRKRRFEKIIHYNNQLYLFSSFPDKEQKKNCLYVQQIDKKTLFPEPDLRPIASIDYEGHTRYNSGTFDHTISRDSSKLLVFYNLPYEKKESERFGFHVLNRDMNQLWEKQITLDYQEELFDVERYRVDNQGNIHLLGQIFAEKRKVRRRGEVNFKYQILSYRNQGNHLTEYPVELPDLYLSDMQIAITEDQNIVCAGFYSEEGTNSIQGSYFLTIDKDTKKIIRKSSKAFDADFVTQNMKKRKAKKTRKKMEKGKDVEMYNYDLDQIVLRDDGGAVLVGEKFFISTVTNTSMMNGTTRYRTTSYYNYHDIIAVNLNPEGVIDWAQKIPKRQTTREDGGFFSSYALAIVDDKMHFIFNDNPKNLVAKPGKVHNFKLNKRESIVVMVTLDAKGKQKKQPLFMAADAETIIRPKVCEQLSDHELIIFGQRKRVQRLAKLDFSKSSRLSSK